MRIMMALALTVLQGIPHGDVNTYVLKNGAFVRAEVLAVEGRQVRLRVWREGRSSDLRRSLDEFAPHSAYRMLRDVSAGRVDDHLKLARYAVDNGLVAVAERELGFARRLAGDPALAEDLGHSIARRGAEALEELFREALGRGEVALARRHVAEILTRYPDGLATSAVQQMLARVDRATTEEKPTAEHRGAEEPAPLMSREHARILRPLTRAMENGSGRHRAGLLASKHFAKAHALMASASRDFDSVIRTGTKLLERHRRYPGLVARVSELVARARVAQQESLLDAASLCVVRGQFSSALGEVNRVLAINPGNRRALDMRARIEIAANEWGYDP